MEKDIAISVSNVSKTFVIPHEKISTLRGAFVSAFHDKSYERFSALKNVSFEVKKGEFFGIIGRNGSGKSTLLKILASIYTPDKGTVKVNGLISPFLELGIGFNPELSGRDNIYLNASVLGLTKKQIDKKFDDIVAFSELKRFIDQKVKNYSSGMNVRLAFSVAIHANSDILLMDEVLAVGDTNFQSKCFEEFNKYRDMGKTVILVTHDIGTVQRYCDRAMLIRNGKIELIGKPDKVVSKYIFQNMSDEEKRIFNEEKRQSETEESKEKTPIQVEETKSPEKIKKIAKVTKVEFFDKKGRIKNVFGTGSDLSAKVSFKKEKSVKCLNFGFTIYSQDNSYIFGINTFIDKIDTTQWQKNGYFYLNLYNLPLKTTTYYVTVGIFGENDKQTYDLVEKVRNFKVMSKCKSHGLVDLKYDWNTKIDLQN